MSDQHSLRAEVQRLNDNALVAVMADHGIVIPAREAMQWRATKRATGSLNGLSEAATILCTNGVVAYFLLGDGRVLFGHVASFDGKVEPAFSVPSSKAVSKPKKERKTSGSEADVKKPSPRKRPTVTPDSIAAALAVLAAATAEQRSE